MNAEGLQLMMDVSSLNDRQVAKKLMVSHPTVIRWRTGKTDIPGPAVVAIDCFWGDGTQGAAEAKAGLELKKRWTKFVSGLTVEDLSQIAEGVWAVEYQQGNFGLERYTEELGHWQVYNDASDCVEKPAALGERIMDLLFEAGKEECEFENEVKSLVAEAERSIMFRFCEEVVRAALMEIYEQNMRKIDED